MLKVHYGRMIQHAAPCVCLGCLEISVNSKETRELFDAIAPPLIRDDQLKNQWKYVSTYCIRMLRVTVSFLQHWKNLEEGSEVSKAAPNCDCLDI